jgi:hypothetical protein
VPDCPLVQIPTASAPSCYPPDAPLTTSPQGRPACRVPGGTAWRRSWVGRRLRTAPPRPCHGPPAGGFPPPTCPESDSVG